MISYHFQIYFEKSLIWQFIKDCVDINDANEKGLKYLDNYIAENYPNFIDHKYLFDIKFCSLDIHLASLKFRGIIYEKKK